jgi:hypothetical protein
MTPFSRDAQRSASAPIPHFFAEENQTMKSALFLATSLAITPALALAQPDTALQPTPATTQSSPAQPQPELPVVQPKYDMEGSRYGGNEYGGGYGYEGGYGRGGYGYGRGPSNLGYERTGQISQLIERWKAAKESRERGRAEDYLRNILTAQFKARLDAHESEIKQLEEKVRQLRQRLNLRREKQDEIVENRLQQILRDAQGLGWGAEGFGESSRNWYGYTTNSSPIEMQDNAQPQQPGSTPRPAGGPAEGEEGADDDLFGVVDPADALSDPAPNRN